MSKVKVGESVSWDKNGKKQTKKLMIDKKNQSTFLEKHETIHQQIVNLIKK